MRFSKLFCKTLKEAPREAVLKSHQLMIRAGLIKKVSSGIYTLLPLGIKIFKKVETIIREEMQKIEAQEIVMPMVIPASQWQESGRWDLYGKELLRFKDRHDNAFCLGPTHEETIVDLVRGDVRSYKELPFCLFQIQTKFRDERRPRFGVMRAREFVMKDAYSFHEDEASLSLYYDKMKQAYKQIFTRCGLDFVCIKADSGSIGGEDSNEFMVLADQGEDTLVVCSQTGQAANIEAFKCFDQIIKNKASETSHKREEVKTPGIKSIEDVATFLKIKKEDCVKALIYDVDQALVMILLRGDHQLNEVKLNHCFKDKKVRPASAQEIKDQLGLEVGFLGPVGVDIPIYADGALYEMSAAVVGGNQPDIHLRNVNIKNEINAQFLDLRQPLENEGSPLDPKGKLIFKKGIEVGHIFKLNDTYSKKMKATFLDQKGAEKPFMMGCYGIGVGRTVAAAIEQGSDDKGIVWPQSIAPFDCVIIVTQMKEEQLATAGEALYQALKQKGVDVLLDDRNCSVGFKFKDAELIGIPYQIVIGKSYLKNQSYEWVDRKKAQNKESAQSDLLRDIEKVCCQ